jgi:cell division septation protein DedD
MRLARVGVIFLSVAVLAGASGCSHEKRDWHAAQSADTIEAYDEFIKEHPTGTRTSEAQARVVQLTEDRDWQRAGGTDTADAYRQFLAAHPQAKMAQEARIRIENFGLNGGAAGATASSASQSARAPPAATEHAPAAAPAPPPVAPPAATEPAENGAGYGVQLGAFSTQAQAQSQWKRVTALYKKELRGAVSEVERGKSSNGRHVYRLKAKVESEARARALCVQLKKHSQPCVVVSLAKR